MAAPSKRVLWGQALMRREVWRRSLTIGVVVGAIQVTINQGDVWLRQTVDATVIVKTIVTPLVALSVAVLSAAGCYVDQMRESQSETETIAEESVCGEGSLPLSKRRNPC